MFVAVAIFAIVLTILIYLTYREKPGMPIFGAKDKVAKVQEIVSKGTSEITNSAEGLPVPMMEQMKRCLRNKTFLFTALCTTLISVHLQVLSTVIG